MPNNLDSEMDIDAITALVREVAEQVIGKNEYPDRPYKMVGVPAAQRDELRVLQRKTLTDLLGEK